MSIGSRRSSSRVVPAWLASPVNSKRQRPCGQIAEATPTGDSVIGQRPALLDVQLDVRRRCRPAARRPGRGSPGPGPAALHRRGQSSRRPRRSGPAPAPASSCPVISRDPAQATPNRAPSSSAKLAIATGLAGVTSRGARSTSTAAKEETTPSGPSNAPPSGHRVQVRAGDDGAWPSGPPPGPLVAVAVGLAPPGRASAACAANQSRHARSAVVQAKRR